MRVLMLDCDLEIDGADVADFGSDTSLYDYDIVFWDPAVSLESYKDRYTPSYQGLPSLGEGESAALKRDVARRRGQFADFVRLGRALIVFVPGDVEVFVDTSRREYSGTGKNRQTTRIVEQYDIMQAVPLPLKREVAAGNRVAPVGHLMKSCFERTEEYWNYRSILPDVEWLTPLLKVNGTSKTVGGMVKEAPDRGTIFLLPDCVWGEDGPGELGIALVEWISSLVGEVDGSLPGWAHSYRFASEVARQEQRERVVSAMAALLEEQASLESSQAEDDQWKLLIAGSGDALEKQAQRAFELLGFTVTKATPGRSDLNLTYGEAPIVVEVKGVSKSAAERHAAQLEKWVAAELEEGRRAKGVLLVNAWRELPPAARPEVAFPAQMLPYSHQRGHCLLTGIQLLSMVRACMNDPSRAPEMAEALLSAEGVLEGWPSDDLFAVIDQEAAEPLREEGGDAKRDALDDPLVVENIERSHMEDAPGS